MYIKATRSGEALCFTAPSFAFPSWLRVPRPSFAFPLGFAFPARVLRSAFWIRCAAFITAESVRGPKAALGSNASRVPLLPCRPPAPYPRLRPGCVDASSRAAYTSVSALRSRNAPVLSRNRPACRTGIWVMSRSARAYSLSCAQYLSRRASGSSSRSVL